MPSPKSAKTNKKSSKNTTALKKKITKKTIKTVPIKNQEAITWLTKYLRYVNYLGAGQLYLKENALLEKELKLDHIKERVLGHWGTVPGLNLIYAHLNYLISKHNDANIYYVCGPGHGAPAVLANLFAEETMKHYYPYLTRDKKGTTKLLQMFSWPDGFPSHTNPGTPGSILEGGELGYSLATAFGSVMDNPDLIAACVVGDGEAETGPLASAWQSIKYLNPKESGAVLPILHANGYKITGPTIYAYMSDKELTELFSGYGYEPKILDFRKARAKDHQELINGFESAYQKIKSIQKKARKSNVVLRPRWPMLIVRSEKGWSGIETLHNEKIEGTYRSHGIPCDPAHSKEDFKAVKHWLESYKIHELIDAKGQPLREVIKFVPKGKNRMGMNPHTNPDKKIHKELNLPEPKKHEVVISKKNPKSSHRNTGVSSNYMRDIFKLNSGQKNFRFFCPDETESNKYQSLFEVTNRAFLWPIKDYDTHLAPDGRVMEVLSEHNLIGWLQGYLLTGRHGIFVTYEAFAMIVASMVDQYAKFIKQALRIKWRNPVASMNIILSSLGWRQEHNGFSHQNPGFVSNIIEKHGKFCSVYFPCDANAMVVTLEDCFKRENSINVIVSSKQFMPQWITVAQAKKEIKKGIAVWDWINPSHAKKPDVVMAASGDAMIKESMAAISILRKDAPEFKIRFVNISELTALGIGDERTPLAIGNKEFEKFFTKNRPIIYNFHGYPGVIKNLVFGHKHADRFSIHGYQEEGTTTTPFEMMVLNRTSRYHLVIDALKKAGHINPVTKRKAGRLIKKYKKFLRDHEKYIRKYGKDMDEVENWVWNYK